RKSHPRAGRARAPHRVLGRRHRRSRTARRARCTGRLEEATAHPMATSASPITVPANGTADGELLQVRNLKMYFPITQGIILQRQVGWVRAVDDITFSVKRGETLGLLGD